jgi:amino acid transporter
MTKPIKTVIYYYLTAALVIFEAIKIFPSGSCGPSLDILIFLGIILLSILLFFINIFRTLNGNKTTNISAIIHFVGCIALIIYFFAGGSL